MLPTMQDLRRLLYLRTTLSWRIKPVTELRLSTSFQVRHVSRTGTSMKCSDTDDVLAI
jgi:hypothetical protein